MTLVYSYKIPSAHTYAGVVTGGDTLVTNELRRFQSGDLHSFVGRTSQNQILCPYFAEGVLNVFSEAACKIGSLNKRTLVAACGDAELIRTILAFYFESSSKIESYSDFFPHFTDDLCTSLSPLERFSEETTAEFIFSIYNGGQVTFVDMRYCVDEKNNLRHQGTYWFPGSTRPAYFKGSIHEQFSDFSGSFHFNSQELHESDIVQQATALEVSKHISIKTGGDAREGVGGAILTYCLDDNGIRPAEDTIYVYASKEKEVSILTKVCYRDGYFYVTDYIERRLTGFAPLERQIRGTEKKSENYIQNLIKDVSEFNAKWLFLTMERENDHEKKFDVRIQGNQSGKVIGNAAHEKFLLKNIKKGKLRLAFKTEGWSETFNFRIRS